MVTSAACLRESLATPAAYAASDAARLVATIASPDPRRIASAVNAAALSKAPAVSKKEYAAVVSALATTDAVLELAF
jgi:hypothetical protein